MSTKQKWVLALTSISSLMVALDVTVVSTALSTIRLHLHASINQLEWTVNAYALSFAVLLMTGASLGDRFGRRKLFAIGLGLFQWARRSMFPGWIWMLDHGLPARDDWRAINVVVTCSDTMVLFIPLAAPWTVLLLLLRLKPPKLLFVEPPSLGLSGGPGDHR